MSIPTISSVQTGGGPNNLQIDFLITGTDFDTATNVTIAGMGDIGFDIIDANNITGHIRAGCPVVTGASLTVTNPDGTSAPAGSITMTDAFTYPVGTGKRFSVISSAVSTLVSDWANPAITSPGSLVISVDPETYAGSIVCDFTGLPIAMVITSLSIVPSSGTPVIDGHNHLLPADYDDVGITILASINIDAQWLFFNNFEIKNCAVKGLEATGYVGGNYTYLNIHDCGIGINCDLNGWGGYSNNNSITYNTIYNCTTAIAGSARPAIVQYNNIYSCGSGINVDCYDSNPLGASIAYNTCYNITGWAVLVLDCVGGGPRPDVSSNICYNCGGGVFFHNNNAWQNYGIFGGGNLVWKCGTPFASDTQFCFGSAGTGYFNPDSPNAINTDCGNGTTYTFLTRPLTQYTIATDKVKYNIGETVAISGSITSQLAITGAIVKVTINKKSDDSVVATILDTTSTPTDFVANTARTLAGIKGSALTWAVAQGIDYYVKLKVSGGFPAVDNPGIVDNIVTSNFAGAAASAGSNVFIVND